VNTFLSKRKDVSNERRYTQVDIYVSVYTRTFLKNRSRKIMGYVHYKFTYT